MLRAFLAVTVRALSVFLVNHSPRAVPGVPFIRGARIIFLFALVYFYSHFSWGLLVGVRRERRDGESLTKIIFWTCHLLLFSGRCATARIIKDEILVYFVFFSSMTVILFLPRLLYFGE